MSLFGSLGGLTSILPIGGGEGGGVGGAGDIVGGLLGTVSGLLGGHDETLVDTGEILGTPDDANNSPTLDLDLFSEPRETHQPSAISVGILPEMVGEKNLLDADLLSGSYGAKYLLTADVGPDGFGPIVSGSILGDLENPLDNPIDLQLLGTPITDVLGGDLPGGDLLGGLL